MMRRYEIECIIETYDDSKKFIEWMKSMGFHTIKMTEIDD